MVQNSTFTDLGAIPSRTQQIQFKHILEAYSFTPTNVPRDWNYSSCSPGILCISYALDLECFTVFNNLWLGV